MPRITKIPGEVLCFQDEGPGDTYRVPFPVRSIISLVVSWKRVVQDHVTANRYLVIRHPESDVGVMCSTVVEDNGAKPYFWDGDLFIIDIRPFMRVKILSSRMVQDDIEFVTWALFDEEKPTSEVFQDEGFQEKIDVLCKLVVRFQFRFVFIGDKQVTIEIDTHSFSEKTIGIFVDRVTERLNEFIDEDPVKELLIAILEEANIEKRLDETIALYELSLECVKEWEEDQIVSQREIVDISRSDLVRQRLFGKRPEDFSVGKTSHSKIDDMEDPNSRKNLISRRIFKKEGGENDKNFSS